MYGLRGLGMAPAANVSSALAAAAAQYGIPPSLLNSVASAESAYNPNAVSPAGAQGLLQIMPANDASLGITNPFDPVQNANAGAKYLSQLYSQYGDWNTALVAYNEGPGNLASQGVFPSSQTYADSIMANSGISDSTSLDSSSIPVDTSSLLDSSGSGAGLSTTALVGLGIAAVVALWAVVD